MRRCVVLIVLIAFALAACGKKHVVTQPDLPPLAPPPPPERVVVPAEPQDASRGGTTDTTNTSGTDKAPKEKPGIKIKTPVPDTTKPAELPPPTSTPVVEPPKQQLQTAEAGAQADEARTLLDQADGARDKVKRELLNADGKEQYDTATGFIRRARVAQAEKNFGLAVRLAKNALTILVALPNR